MGKITVKRRKFVFSFSFSFSLGSKPNVIPLAVEPGREITKFGSMAKPHQ